VTDLVFACSLGRVVLPSFPTRRSSDLAHCVATSEYLFPVFAERVLSPRRPDRRRVLDTLGLEPAAGAFEIMARNGGRPPGETIELIQLPTPTASGARRMAFLAHALPHGP